VSASIRYNGDHRKSGLSVTVEPRLGDGDTVLALHGEFDLTGIQAFELAAACAEPVDSLVLDLSDVSFMDSSGIGALVGLHRRAQSEGWSLVLAAPGPQVAGLLALTGLNARITIIERIT
jgi:anti-sigma B factor antagonist